MASLDSEISVEVTGRHTPPATFPRLERVVMYFDSGQEMTITPKDVGARRFSRFVGDMVKRCMKDTGVESPS